MNYKMIFKNENEPRDTDEMIFGRGGTVPSDR